MLYRTYRRPGSGPGLAARTAAAAACLVAAYATPAAAQTQPPSPPVTTGAGSGGAAAAQSPDESEAAIQRGIELRRQGRDADALAEFRRAYDRTRTPRALAQIALAEQALGQWVDAERHLNEALASSDDAWIARNLEALRASRAAIGQHLGSLDVVGSVPGAEVYVEGERVAALPLREPLRVPAGSVNVEVRAPGYRPVVRTVFVEPRGMSREQVRMLPVPREGDGGEAGGGAGGERGERGAAGATRGISPLVWIGGGVALLGVGAGVSFGVGGNVVSAAYRGLCTDPMQEPRGDCAAQYASAQGTLTAYGVMVGVSWAVAAAGAAMLVVGLVTSDFRGRAQAQGEGAVGRTGRRRRAGVTVRPTFDGARITW